MTLPKCPERTTFSFAFSYIERALVEGLADRQFGETEMMKVLEYFGDINEPGCVYCGAQPIRRWDHLIAIRKGGHTVLGNMVHACASCDDSKQDKPFDLWMISDAPGSPKSRHIPDLEGKLRKLRGYAAHFQHSPTHPEGCGSRRPVGWWRT